LYPDRAPGTQKKIALFRFFFIPGPRAQGTKKQIALLKKKLYLDRALQVLLLGEGIAKNDLGRFDFGSLEEQKENSQKSV
jgi:hypothetical protein